MKQNVILLLACHATQIVMGEPSLAEKNAAENTGIKKEWESWNALFPLFRLIGASSLTRCDSACDTRRNSGRLA